MTNIVQLSDPDARSHWRVNAGDSLPVWGLMIILMLPDGSGRRGVKVFYDVVTGKLMVRWPARAAPVGIQC